MKIWGVVFVGLLGVCKGFDISGWLWGNDGAIGVVETEEKVDGEALREFERWFVEKGGVAERLELREFEGMGVGVAVREGERVSAEEVVIRVPLSAVVWEGSVWGEGSVLEGLKESEEARGLSAEGLLATFLGMQRALGPGKSSWWPYVRALPRSIPSLLTWSDEELGELGSPWLVEVAKREKVTAREEWERGRKLANRAGVDLGWKEFEWAKSVLSSRALTLRGRRVLVPFADFFNHEGSDGDRVANGGEAFLRHHVMDEEGGEFRVLSDRGASGGEQLLEDYGDSTNQVYLQYHGFVDETNVFECAHVSLPRLDPPTVVMSSALEQRYKTRVTILRDYARLSADVLDGSKPVCVPAADKSKTGLGSNPAVAEFQGDLGLPRWASVYLRVLALSDDELERCRERKSTPTESLQHCLGIPRGRDVDDAKRWLRAVKDTKQTLNNTPLASQPRNPASISNTTRTSIAQAWRRTQTELLSRVERTLTQRIQTLQSPRKPTKPSSSTNTSRVETQLASELQQWLDSLGAEPRKIEAKWIGNGLGLGAVATTDLAQGQIYLGVPVEAILSRESARQSALAPLFSELDKVFRHGDPFHELLFHLIYEKYVLGLDSEFWPYLNSLPSQDELGNALVWTEDQLEQARGLELWQQAMTYRTQTKSKFQGVQKAVMERFAEHVPQGFLTYQRYLWATAILDSRSIWWNGQRHLVPLLDLVNCIQGPKGHTIHSTQPNDENTKAITKAGWSFRSGEQVFEDYGQPNHIYLLYHGFVLDENRNDCAQVVLDAFALGIDVEKARPNLERAGYDGARFLACLSDDGGAVDGTTDGLRALHFIRAAMGGGIEEKEAKAILAKVVQNAFKQLEQNQSIQDQEEALVKLQRLENSDPVTLAITKFRLQQTRLLRRIWESIDLDRTRK